MENICLNAKTLRLTVNKCSIYNLIETITWHNEVGGIMLKNVLGRYDEIILLNREADEQQNSILLMESVYDHIEKFNNEYVELSAGNESFSPVTAIIRNPQEVHTISLNDREDSIMLVYNDDVTIKMVGHKR